MTTKQITQKVIDFQFSLTRLKDQAQYYYQQQQHNDHNNHNMHSHANNLKNKFSQWSLDKTISQLGLQDRREYRIRWGGCDQRALLEVFLYCLFKGCKNGLAYTNGVYIKLKAAIYDLAAVHLTYPQQKRMVELLCAAEYTKDLGKFFNQNQVIFELFQKLIKKFGTSIGFQSQTYQFQMLNQFSKNFQFLFFQIKSPHIALFQHLSQKFYIIVQKGCYFIVETDQQKNNIKQIKRVRESTLQSRPQTQVNSQPQPQSQPSSATIQSALTQAKPKKILQYTAPKFLLQNNKRTNKSRKSKTKSKGKRQPRYTQLHIEEYNQFQLDQSVVEGKGRDKLTEGYKDKDKAVGGQGVQGSAQKLNKRREFYKQQPKRFKTCLVQSKSANHITVTSNQKHKLHEEGQDNSNQKQQSRLHKFKKIELNLKKITSHKLLNVKGHNFHHDNLANKNPNPSKMISPGSKQKHYQSHVLFTSSNGNQFSVNIQNYFDFQK